MDMRIIGIVVIHGTPVDLPVKIGLHLVDQFPGKLIEVKIIGIFRRNDKAELMRLTLNLSLKTVPIKAVFITIELAGRSILFNTTPLNILDMQHCGSFARRSHLNDSCFYDDPACIMTGAFYMAWAGSTVSVAAPQ